ncbi:hypothetical protein ACFO9E_18105 [Streptomyces maoxianensis]|uniref:Flagellar biosynthesis anti-sigma factor FlgM n=1 Tax=Streptomyces maoxianensis TaxID=1459942 RepID=A0ABV9G9T6_9ACTN
MWHFNRHSQVSPESVAAVRDAEKSLKEAQAGSVPAEAKLIESRRVTEQLKAHNRANAYSDLIEGIVLGRLRNG